MQNYPYLTNRSQNVENGGMFGIEGSISPTNQNVKLPKLPGNASGRVFNTEGGENKNNLMKSYGSRKMSNERTFSQDRNRTV
jgi:hypothetical protein